MDGVRRARSIELAVAIVFLALGLFVLAGSLSIETGSGYDRIGPRLFPTLVGTGLLISAAALIRGALRNRTGAASIRWRVVSTLIGTLAATVVLLELAGFIASTALLFWLVAHAFESDRPKRDAVVGLGLSIVVYVVFTRGLGLSLPTGVLSGLI